MAIFNSSQSIGEIVAVFPKASEVFMQYKIDFCCGGGRPLAEALKEQQLDENEVLMRLEEALGKNSETGLINADFTKMSQGDLIDYIVGTHHDYMKKALPELDELTDKITKVHGMKHEELSRIRKLFSTLKSELEQHLVKEEEQLFPLMKKYAAAQNDELMTRIIKAMKETEEEHEGAGHILKELRDATGEYEVPRDGCATYDLTFRRLMDMEADLFQHIHLENNILFKKNGY